MKVVDAIAEVLKREGVEYLMCYPVSPIIEAAAAAGIRPIVCRQERVGMGIADGYSRITNGQRMGVFAMQAGPGSENAFPGVSTAYADSVPVLVLPMGYPRAQADWPRFFSSSRSYAAVTKWVEQINTADQVTEALRRAFSRLKMGRPGPVMLELPADVAAEELDESALAYRPVKATRSGGNVQDVDEAARALVEASSPVIHAGQGVLYAGASPELVELAELLQAPVMTSLLGKSAFPEDHPLALGTAALAKSKTVTHFLERADLVLGVGCSFTRHGISNVTIPPGKVMVQITNDEADINKHYAVDHPIIGDAKLVLRQLLDALKDRLGGKGRPANGVVAGEIKAVREAWLREWMPKLTSDEVPINPYRVVWELMHTVPPGEAIVTHDSGSPREQMVPFYQAAGPRSYIGWGKSHALGTGLGLAMGAKLAAPDKVVVNWMGDSAFGMVGMDFETAVRCRIPIITIVSNNFSMAIETPRMQVSRERFRATDTSGNYSELAKALGGYAERVEDPAEVGPAIQRARQATEQEGRPALLEMITCEEINYSRG